MADVSKIAANGIDYNVKDATARSGLSTANSNISTLQSNMTTAQGNITSLQSAMTTAQGNITALQTQVNGMIESGSGYCKLSDGTMMQWGILTVTSATFSAYGSLYQTTVSLTLPKRFIDANYVVSGSSKTINGAAEFGIGQSGTTATSVSIRVIDVASRTVTSSDPMKIRWMAIGRWK